MNTKGASLLDGKKAAFRIEEDLKNEIQSIGGRPPQLAVIQVGDNPASSIYVKRKAEACERVGILSKVLKFEADLSEKALLKEIEKLNQAPDVDGILVQLPLPSHIDTSKIILAIDPKKDVDGFHPENVGKLLLGQKGGFVSCTPLGIQLLLKHYHVDLTGKHVVIVGRSNIVGKPLAAILMQNEPLLNATVTVAHSQTKQIEKLIQEADVVIAAMGRPKFIQGSWIKPQAIVIDVGITKVDGKISGDVDFEKASLIASQITPVPGGIGPMTIAALLTNTLKSRRSRS